MCVFLKRFISVAIMCHSKLATFLNKVHTLQWQMSLGPNDIFIRPWQFAILIMR